MKLVNVSGISAHFEMPYEFIRGDIEKSLKEKYKQLKDYIRKVETKKGKCFNYFL